ncbi:hypothetical protein [Candidatus Ichthyocystis sparus]|uniref:hypothetical protein n=1 Tax=Candidatus Ichthyocystis sparus TaxID=1561004 RepID=UPI000B890E8D|nr:hypothetical protein [Candidatus Ichthyocystis sparus]
MTPWVWLFLSFSVVCIFLIYRGSLVFVMDFTSADVYSSVSQGDRYGDGDDDPCVASELAVDVSEGANEERMNLSASFDSLSTDSTVSIASTESSDSFVLGMDLRDILIVVALIFAIIMFIAIFISIFFCCNHPL